MQTQTQTVIPQFSVQLAQGAADLRAAQALRYQVFVAELGGAGPGVDHVNGLETDPWDDLSHHLILRDLARSGHPVVGVYRLLDSDGASAAGGFYSETEYDLTPLQASGRRLLELGRSCLHRDYRGGAALLYLWQALADYVARHRFDILFGVASFHGTDPQIYAQALSQLAAQHMAPPALRPRSRAYQPMDLLRPDQIDRRRAMKDMPALIKAYLRLGGMIGDGAYVDRAFNTIDVCLVLDMGRLNQRQRALHTRGLP